MSGEVVPVRAMAAEKDVEVLLGGIGERREEALAALMRRTIQVQEEERRRVATEIHDGVTQHLVSIWFRVHAAQRLLERGQLDQGLEEIRATKDVIDQTLDEARAAIYNLRPATLDDLGLTAALRELASRSMQESELEVELDAPPDVRLPAHLETALYRVTQEALTNVRKHARARHVAVRLTVGEHEVELSVTDDGAGFDLGAFTASRSTTSFGLTGMRERIELVHGTLGVRSAAGEGTTLVARVPLTDPPEPRP